MTVIDVALVALDSDIEDELGEDVFERLIDDATDGLKARTHALEDVEYELNNRVPPIRPGEVSDLSELKRVVVYGACAHLYKANLTTGSGDDINSAKHDLYREDFMKRLVNLRPTVGTQLRAASSTIALHRR
jgi:hypothetical protein